MTERPRTKSTKDTKDLKHKITFVSLCDHCAIFRFTL